MNGIGELQDDIIYSIRYDKQGSATVTEHHKLKGTLWECMELLRVIQKQCRNDLIFF